MTATAFTKTVRLGTVSVGRRNASVFCKVTFDGRRLSITGVEGPTIGGNCLGGCGQIDTHLTAAAFRTLAPGWSRALVAKFLDTWGRWHLNDMRAGSPAQRDFIRELPAKDYDTCRAELTAAGLEPDQSHHVNGKPYAFGSAWLFEAVPAEVLAFLSGLPDTDRAPAWV